MEEENVTTCSQPASLCFDGSAKVANSFGLSLIRIAHAHGPVQSSPVDDVIERRTIACSPSFHGKSIDRTLGPSTFIRALRLTSTRSATRVIDSMKTLLGQYTMSREGS